MIENDRWDSGLADELFSARAVWAENDHMRDGAKEGQVRPRYPVLLVNGATDGLEQVGATVTVERIPGVIVSPSL